MALRSQRIAFRGFINATAVALFLRLGALDWVLVCEMLCYDLLHATRFLGDGGYSGSYTPGVLAIHPVRVAHYFDNPVFAGDAQMKLVLYFFRLEPLVDVLDNRLENVGVGGF
jgi:hypothetical protein